MPKTDSASKERSLPCKPVSRQYRGINRASRHTGRVCVLYLSGYCDIHDPETVKQAIGVRDGCRRRYEHGKTGPKVFKQLGNYGRE
jgi:hypothetical protein